MKKTFLLLTMMLSALCSWAEEEYDLWFQGVRVTSDNCDALLWGNMVRYDASSKTLTFDDQTWVNNDYVNDYAIVNNIPDLTIQFNGGSGLEGMKGAIYSTEHFVISGNGVDISSVQIYDNNSDSPAIYAEKGVTIQWCDVNIYGMQDTGIEGQGMLTMNGGKLYSDLIQGFDDMQYYNGSYLASPIDGQYDTVNKQLGSGNSYVQVDVHLSYSLTVAGIAVTNENAADILNDQTVSYEPTTKTLTLNNADIEYDAEVIHSQIDGLTIRLIGDNVLTSHYAGCIDSQGKDLTIEGYTPSRCTLKLQQNYDGTAVEDGFSYLSGNTLIKNCTVSGNKIMNMSDDETVTLELQRARISLANIEGFAEVTVSHAYIASPTDCSYDKTQKSFVAGSTPTTSLHIEPYLLAYNGQDVTPSNPISPQRGAVTYDADARILTMNNAELGELTKGVGLAIFDDHTIRLEGTNKLSAYTGALCFEAGDLTIQGPGHLDIQANIDAFAGNTSYNPYSFNYDQNFTIRKATLYCRAYSRRSTATDLIYNVINSNFTFDENPVGYGLIACKKMNLTNSELIEPAAFDLDKLYATFEGKIVIEAQPGIPGDIDGDNQLGVTDIIYMLRHLTHSLSDIPELDVNGDGKFTKTDIEALANKILGK